MSDSCVCVESLCGIFVKRVAPGSVADTVGKIQTNDQVVQVSRIETNESTTRWFR